MTKPAPSPSSSNVLRLSPKQDKFVYDSPGVSLYRGAIASGKTYAGAIKTFVRREKYPGTVEIIGGPSWDQLRDGTQRSLERLMPAGWITYRNDQKHLWRVHNGSELIFRTLDDPDVLRALEGHDFWCDEISLCTSQSLDIGLGRIRLTHEDPTFRNEAWGTTTPRGMDWTLDTWGMDGKPGFPVVHSTIYDNRANLPAGYIERLEEKYRDTPFFEQELLGLYTAFEGLVYPMFHQDKHIRQPAWRLEDSERISVGVDFGGTADPSAMVLIGEHHNKQHQFAEFYKVGAELGEMLARLDEWAQLSKRIRAQVMVRCDPSGTVLTTTIAGAGFSCLPAERDKTAGILLVAQRLNGSGGVPQFTLSPSNTYTKTEYGHYVWSKKKAGETNVVYFTKTPIDHHADLMDATRYAHMGLAQSGVRKPVRLSGGYRVR